MRKSCGTHIYGRMIPLHQSFAWEPLRLYGSLCAVKVVLAALRSTAGALDCARSANYVELHIIGEMLRTQKCGVGRKSARFTGVSANQLHINDEELWAVLSTTGDNYEAPARMRRSLITGHLNSTEGPSHNGKTVRSNGEPSIP